jgi:hypothetical protein
MPLGWSVGSFVVRAFGGMALFMVGGVLMGLGFMRPMAEISATETAHAVEHTSAAMGRGLSKGLRQDGFQWGGNARPVVKVRCRSCGALDSEDAKFCSACAKPM